MKPLGARLVDAVEYRDVKRTVGIVSLSGLKSVSIGWRSMCVLRNRCASGERCRLSQARAVRYASKHEIPLVHLKSTANVDEAAVKTLEDTEEAMAEFAKSVSECSPEVRFLSSQCCCGQ